jgi:hypothetical protein
MQLKGNGGWKQDPLEENLQPLDMSQVDQCSKGGCVADHDGHGAQLSQALEALDLLCPESLIQS